MQRLVATATTAASAASCSRDADVKTVTITPLPSVATVDTTPIPPSPTASATFTPPPVPPPPPDPSGYLVVDMLPAPARCLGIAASTKATGKFHRDGGGMALDLVIALTQAQALFVNVSSASAWGGTLSSATANSQNTVVRARVILGPQRPGDAASVGLSVPVSCGAAGTGSLAVTATYTAPAVDGAAPSIVLHDY